MLEENKRAALRRAMRVVETFKRLGITADTPSATG
jgi:hypothetical protein